MKSSIIILALLLCIAPASAQKHYLLQTVTGAGGGSQASSSSYWMGNTVGAPGNNLSTSSGYASVSGFWGEYEALRDFYASSLLVADGWNLVSVASTVADYRRSALFPSAISSAFSYQRGYIMRDTLKNGNGYWLKFSAAQSVGITGMTRTSDTVIVAAGWNLIGSVSEAVSTGAILQIPPDIVVSQYFGYNAGYSPASSIEPGRAYWVKAGAGGKLVLNVPAAFAPVAARTQVQDELAGLNHLTISQVGGHTLPQLLYFGRVGTNTGASEFYEMPPMAPKGAFDARFSSNQFAEFFSEGAKEVPIMIQSDGSPLELSWTLKEQSGLSYLLVERKAEKLLSEYRLRPGGKVTLNSAKDRRYSLRVAEVPSTYALEQNYPNPFNPTATIRYQLPVDSRVTIKVYDMLGSEVATLVDAEMEAGHQSVEWNASGFASGVYIYRLSVTGTSNQRTFNDVKKMMLLK